MGAVTGVRQEEGTWAVQQGARTGSAMHGAASLPMTALPGQPLAEQIELTSMQEVEKHCKSMNSFLLHLDRL